MDKHQYQNMNTINVLLIFIAVFFVCTTSLASEKVEPIPMYEKGADTFYIKGEIRGLGTTEFMVDTGSGYMTINEETLEVLKSKGEATYVKELLCILANGKEEIYPVYRIASIQLGKDCVLTNVEAAVFPGKTRHILGLSGLKRAGSFSFSFDPPQLSLASCA